MKDNLKTLLVIFGIIAAFVPVGFWMAHFQNSQSAEECYSWGKVTNNEVKFVGDGNTGGYDTGCFVKNGNKWENR